MKLPSENIFTNTLLYPYAYAYNNVPGIMGVCVFAYSPYVPICLKSNIDFKESLCFVLFVLSEGQGRKFCAQPFLVAGSCLQYGKIFSKA